MHRVAFGAKSSWVVIGKDGSVKWKNVPQGLHDVLIAHELGLPGTLTPITKSDSTSPAEYSSPCEVSLGIGGTYFLRFLDGRVDYSLPNFVADIMTCLNDVYSAQQSHEKMNGLSSMTQVGLDISRVW